MAGDPSHEVTQLFKAWSSGHRAALDRLIPLVYDKLHRLAHSQIRREHSDDVFQTTALVNEAYLRLVDSGRVNWNGRNHSIAIAARLMRLILVHSARSHNAQKRGGKMRRVSLSDSALAQV